MVSVISLDTLQVTADGDLMDVMAMKHSKREVQRQRMARWRQQKKASIVSLNKERQQLEKKLQRSLHKARDVAKPLNVTEDIAQEAYRQVTVEAAELTVENQALKDEIARRIKFEERIRSEEESMKNEPPETTTTTATTTLHQDVLGWRVCFPNDAPSFHYFPFARVEFDAALKRNIELLRNNYSASATVGKLFGWTADYSPLKQNVFGKSFMAHGHFSRRLNCSIEHIESVLPRLPIDLWPVVATSRSWGHVQNGVASQQVLQTFDPDSRVLACNIPGDVHLRYIAMAQHARRRLADGKRVDTYTIVVSDPNFDSEEDQNEVLWLSEGGTQCTITAVDETSTDIVYDHWAGCRSEALGRGLYIDWIRFVVQLEQNVSPTRLLAL